MDLQIATVTRLDKVTGHMVRVGQELGTIQVTSMAKFLGSMNKQKSGQDQHGNAHTPHPLPLTPHTYMYTHTHTHTHTHTVTHSPYTLISTA